MKKIVDKINREVINNQIKLRGFFNRKMELMSKKKKGNGYIVALIIMVVSVSIGVVWKTGFSKIAENIIGKVGTAIEGFFAK